MDLVTLIYLSYFFYKCINKQQKETKIKKLLFIFVFLAILGAGTAFADYPSGFGIGVQGGGGGLWQGSGFSLQHGAALSLKIPNLPVFWIIDYNNIDSIKYLGIAGDFYFVHNPLVQSLNLHWYLGLGAFAEVGFGEESDLFLSAVARLPIGLSWQLHFNIGIFDALEVYLQAAPSIGVAFLPDFRFPTGGWPINLGARIWF